MLAEYSSQTPTSPCGTATCYLVTDHLGSTRMLTDTGGSNGTASTNVHRYDFLPFGGELGQVNGRTAALGYSATLDTMNPRFTGQMRDAETYDPNGQTALDWFNVRHMSGAQGRFQSPDPGNAGADPSNPQTWNAYAYVGNNPLSYTDPSGESWWSTLIGVGLDIAGFFTGGTTTILGTILTTAGTIATGGSIGGGIIGDISGGVNSGQPWNEQIPGLGGGSLSTGGTFGSGNTDPFVFSFEDGSQSWLQQNFGWLWAPPILPPYVKNDVPIYGLQGKGAQVLAAAGNRATHDLGCVGLGGVVTGGSIAASAEVIPKPFSAGGTSGTSIASKVLSGGNIGRVLTPVGTPGVNLAWKYSANLGRIAGRWLPYAGTVAGAVTTYACLGTNP